MTIAVTTPSGNVGSFLVRQLLRAGVRPLLLTRHPEAIDPGLAGLVDVAAVDVTEPGALRAVTAGVDALYAVVPPTGAPDPLAAYARIGQDLAEAVRANGIRRTVLQSSVGAELRQGAGEIDGLGAVEEALDAAVAGTEQGVVHLRCGFFFSNLLFQLDALRDGVVPVLWPTDHPLAWVAPRDVAEVAAGFLLRGDWSGRHVRAVHGPRDLSWDEAMAVVSEVLGREVRAVRVPDDDMRAGLLAAGMTTAQVEAMVGMATGLREGFVPEQPRDATTTTATSLGGWTHDVLRPLLAEG